MINTFYVNKENLDETKDFIKTLKSAKFKTVPLEIGDKVNITVEVEPVDSFKLSEYLTKYYVNNNISHTPQVPFYMRFLNIIKN